MKFKPSKNLIMLLLAFVFFAIFLLIVKGGFRKKGGENLPLPPSALPGSNRTLKNMPVPVSAGFVNGTGNGTGMGNRTLLSSGLQENGTGNETNGTVVEKNFTEKRGNCNCTCSCKCSGEEKEKAGTGNTAGGGKHSKKRHYHGYYGSNYLRGGKARGLVERKSTGCDYEYVVPLPSYCNKGFRE